MEKTIEIPEGYEARIEGNKVILEPKVSEDERIRKELIEYLTHRSEVTAFIDEDKDCKRWIAYLERQKEQKPMEDDTRTKIISRATSEKQVVLISESNGDVEIGSDTRSLEDTKKLLEWGIAFINKQLGTKPTEWSYPYGRNETVDKLVSIAECLEMDGDCLFNGYSGTECGKFLRELARKQIGCKPAEWRDADMKEARANLISCCLDWERGEKTTLLPVVAVRARYFLEHLVEPRPAEWSVEDKRILKGIIGLVDHDQHYGVSNNEMLTWLKSLRPQPKQEWSEDDKECLKELIQYIEQRIGDGTTGQSLWKKWHSWLYSLPERLNLSSEQKWSEEDVEKLAKNRASKSGTLKSEMIFYRQGVRDAFNYKGMRPHWKPSKKQMAALKTVVSWDSKAYYMDGLESLYNDLKSCRYGRP